MLTVFGKRKGLTKASLTLYFRLDNMDKSTKALEKLGLHNNDFHLPSSFAWREPCLKDLFYDMLGSVPAHESYIAESPITLLPRNSNNKTT